MMFIDMFWMAFAAWYISNVWPSEYGTHKPVYFIFMPSFWTSTFSSCLSCFSHSGQAVTSYSQVRTTEGNNDTIPVEPVTDALRSQINDKTCVDIINLYKEFNTSTGNKVAVDGLNLTMYSGQITALLGHNGAGRFLPIAIRLNLFDFVNVGIQGRRQPLRCLLA